MTILSRQMPALSVRQLALGCGWLLGGIVLLTIMVAVITWTAQVRRENDAWTINIAGRQRLFAERIAKAALVIQGTTDRQERERAVRELSLVVDEWERVHRGLQVGDPSLDLQPVNGGELRQAFRRLEPQFQVLREAAKKILESAALEEVATIGARARYF